MSGQVWYHSVTGTQSSSSLSSVWLLMSWSSNVDITFSAARWRNEYRGKKYIFLKPPQDTSRYISKSHSHTSLQGQLGSRAFILSTHRHSQTLGTSAPYKTSHTHQSYLALTMCQVLVAFGDHAKCTSDSIGQGWA